MDKNELYRMKDELLNSKAQDLEQIEDHKEYAMRANEQRDFREKQMQHDAMRANEQRDFREKQMQHDAIRAAEQSEERFRKMMHMGEEKQDIEHKNITQEIIKNNKEIEEIKKHR